MSKTKATKAIVTLTIGEKFVDRWQADCRANWQHYADQHGYDLICIDTPLDHSMRAQHRSPAWQKCLILGQDFSNNYERIVWIDSDILINPNAPDICASVPLERVGAVDEFATPSRNVHRQTLQKLYRLWEQEGIPFIHNASPQEYYQRWGLPHGFGQVVQTGVMVLSPSHHRSLLENCYHHYDDKGMAWNYEMRPLSFELLEADCIHWLDPRFNFIWGKYKSIYAPFFLGQAHHPRTSEYARQALEDVYLLHFTGNATQDMAFINTPPPPPQRAFRSNRVASTLQPTPSTPYHLQRTPVVFLIFNRPDTTQQVFERIRQAQPSLLLVVADGPRADRADDEEKCAATRAIIEQVDWPCEVRQDYAAHNLGVKKRVESGLDWAFAQVEEAIILEDDCVPDPSFFRFCEELLEHYRHNEQILSISGNNFQFGQSDSADSYYFSHHSHIWGWATWRRAWQMYDAQMTEWPRLLQEGWLSSRLDNHHAAQYWSFIFQQNFQTRTSWAYAWRLSYWRQGGLHILPNVNLVSNIGFGAEATHTQEVDSKFAFLPVTPLNFPLQHPQHITRNVKADDFTEEVMYSGTLKQLFARVRKRSIRERQS